MNREEHLILRLPEEWTMKLNQNTKVEFSSLDVMNEEPGRVFQVRLGPHESLAYLLDLPTIVETHKTLDNINFFKNSDICQMVYVIPEYEKEEPRAKSN